MFCCFLFFLCIGTLHHQCCDSCTCTCVAKWHLQTNKNRLKIRVCLRRHLTWLVGRQMHKLHRLVLHTHTHTSTSHALDDGLHSHMFCAIAIFNSMHFFYCFFEMIFRFTSFFDCCRSSVVWMSSIAVVSRWQHSVHDSYDVFSSVSISYVILALNIDNTYSVWMLFIESNVPFASDWMLLSYNDNKLKLVKSRNESFRMHDISLAFSNNNCNDVNPRNTFAGKSLILLPYRTLFAKISKEETEMVGR